MSKRSKILTILTVVVVAVTAFAAWRLFDHGISARDEPTAVERVVARWVRDLAIPSDLAEAENPVEVSEEVLAEGREHFADHCASCHGNDGRGDTTIGRNLYPKAPDMTLEATQSMTDGELFAIIKNGVRLTGMPAWGDDSPESDRQSWELVHFIRHLPKITDEEIEEMQSMNPVYSENEIATRVDEELFLAGMPVEGKLEERESSERERHH